MLLVNVLDMGKSLICRLISDRSRRSAILSGRRLDRRQALARLVALLFLFALLAPLSVSAQEDVERIESFVYGINASVPGAVVGTFAPPIVDEIYLLTGYTSILSPRRTNIYYWPITNEYRAAWSSLNEGVEGTLEVLQGGEVLTTLERTPYTIHFSQGEGAPKPQLYTGDEAFAADERFLAEQEAYRQATIAYQEAREAWLEEARQAQARGEDPQARSPAPEPPPVFNTFSTGVNLGFPLDLEEGSYQIRTRRPDGEIVPDSVRDLVVFGPRRTGVGYEVIPEKRWTFPEETNAPSDAILADPDSVLFLKPHIAREYPALAYERLQDPQYKGSGGSSEWSWESGEFLEEGILEIARGGEVEERVPLQAYFVKQNPGKEFGYEIWPYDPNTPELTPRADFVGYRIDISSDRPPTELRLRSADNEIMVGSPRAIRMAEQNPLPYLLLIALVPVLLGTVIILWRRRRTALTKTSDS